MNTPRHATSSPAGVVRFGFTLLELLVTVTIIAILIGLLVVAVQPARTRAQEARVRNDIAALETALEQFKAQYGDYPPSRITLYEKGSDWAGTGTEQVRSRGILRRFWNRINFNIDRDFDLDGVKTGTIELKGAECLVFFLGGVPRNGAGATTLNGFAKSETDPFDRSAANRVGPFLDFDPGRLQISNRVKAIKSDTNILVYLDTWPNQTNPYVYLSSYDGRGYVANDGSDWIANGAYTQTGGGAWKPKTFQIISPGFNQSYGPGGTFNADTASADLAGSREDERDNITNFHNSVLAPN